MGVLSKERRDVFYRKAKEDGYRARSAYKLEQIDGHFGLLSEEGITKVVDLCAAPGSWSQYLSNRLRDIHKGDEGWKIVAVDLQEMAPIVGVHIICGDITSKETCSQVLEQFGAGRAQLVVCDGAPDVTGLHELDEFNQNHLVSAALRISASMLEIGGRFVTKIFKHEFLCDLVSMLELFFQKVTLAKPSSSRLSSQEAFLVCEGFSPPADFMDAWTLDRTSSHQLKGTSSTNKERQFVEYANCGDFDSVGDPDKTNPTFQGEALPPLVPPIKPAFEAYLQK